MVQLLPQLASQLPKKKSCESSSVFLLINLLTAVVYTRLEETSEEIDLEK